METKDLKVGREVYVKHPEMENILVGRVMSVCHIGDKDFVEIYTCAKGVVCVECSNVYADFNDARKAISPMRQKDYYEETSTVEGLLKFLERHRMLYWHDANDDAVAVIRKRLDEIGAKEMEGQV